MPVGTFQVLKLLFVRKYKRYHFFYFLLIYASIFTSAEIIFYNFIEPFLIVQANYELNWKFYRYRDIPEKIQTGFQKYWRKSMWKFLGLVKKEVEFPGVLMKNSCGGISMGLEKYFNVHFLWMDYKATTNYYIQEGR